MLYLFLKIINVCLLIMDKFKKKIFFFPFNVQMFQKKKHSYVQEILRGIRLKESPLPDDGNTGPV